MLEKAKQKITVENVKFVQANVNKDWIFTENKKFDLATFSLVLEHIENLDNIFTKLSKVLHSNSTVYIGALHLFKQYDGTKARFETNEGQQIVTYFNHNISNFINSAKKYSFQLIDINEYFDDEDINNTPRILSMIFKKR
jgi:ubiquinone/menaquinone biosynthesis C-methylase UbiE